MKEEKEKWEDIIRSKMYDFEADTHPDDWDLISAKLSGGKTVALHSYQKYGYAAAVAAVLLIMGGLYFFPHEEQLSEQLAIVEKPVDNVLETAIKPVDATGSMVEKPVETSVNNLLKTPEKATDEHRVAKVEAVEEPPVQLRPLLLEDDAPQVNIPEPEVVPEVPEVVPEADVEKIENEILYGFDEVEPVDIDLSDERLVAEALPEVRRRRWGFGMGGGGYAAHATSNALGVSPFSASYNDYEALLDQQVVHLRNAGQPLVSNEVVSEKNLNHAEYLSGKVKHKTPISAGLGVSYYLNDRWSLQSGAVYTLLRSKGNYNDDIGNAVEWKQNLHYVGIPLSVSYKIAEWNRLQWYASAGGMCEFNVSGKMKKTIEVEGLKAKESENMRMKTPLWSVNARTGVAYPLWKFLHVYAEAGASYYFDNHSDIETIRSDKPFNVSLQAGIRLGF